MILKIHLFISRHNIDPCYCLRLREETSDGCQRVTCNCQMQSELQGKHRQHQAKAKYTKLEVIQPSHAWATQKLWRKSRERGPMIGISMALKYAQTMLKDLTALKNVFLFLVAAWMTQMQCNTLVQCNAALSAQTRSSHCILSMDWNQSTKSTTQDEVRAQALWIPMTCELQTLNSFVLINRHTLPCYELICFLHWLW